jgi:hypothetical protein
LGTIGGKICRMSSQRPQAVGRPASSPFITGDWGAPAVAFAVSYTTDPGG